METLFSPRQYVICINSRGTFADGTPLKLTEEKSYQVKSTKIVEDNGQLYTMVELFMVTGWFMASRFMDRKEYNELENEIFNLMKH